MSRRRQRESSENDIEQPRGRARLDELMFESFEATAGDRRSDMRDPRRANLDDTNKRALEAEHDEMLRLQSSSGLRLNDFRVLTGEVLRKTMENRVSYARRHEIFRRSPWRDRRVPQAVMHQLLRILAGKNGYPEQGNSARPLDSIEQRFLSDMDLENVDLGYTKNIAGTYLEWDLRHAKFERLFNIPIGMWHTLVQQRSAAVGKAADVNAADILPAYSPLAEKMEFYPEPDDLRALVEEGQRLGTRFGRRMDFDHGVVDRRYKSGGRPRFYNMGAFLDLVHANTGLRSTAVAGTVEPLQREDMEELLPELALLRRIEDLVRTLAPMVLPDVGGPDWAKESMGMLFGRQFDTLPEICRIRARTLFTTFEREVRGRLAERIRENIPLECVLAHFLGTRYGANVSRMISTIREMPNIREIFAINFDDTTSVGVGFGVSYRNLIVFGRFPSLGTGLGITADQIDAYIFIYILGQARVNVRNDLTQAIQNCLVRAERERISVDVQTGIVTQDQLDATDGGRGSSGSERGAHSSGPGNPLRIAGTTAGSTSAVAPQPGSGPTIVALAPPVNIAEGMEEESPHNNEGRNTTVSSSSTSATTTTTSSSSSGSTFVVTDGSGTANAFGAFIAGGPAPEWEPFHITGDAGFPVEMVDGRNILVDYNQTERVDRRYPDFDYSQAEGSLRREIRNERIDRARIIVHQPREPLAHITHWQGPGSWPRAAPVVDVNKMRLINFSQYYQEIQQTTTEQVYNAPVLVSAVQDWITSPILGNIEWTGFNDTFGDTGKGIRAMKYEVLLVITRRDDGTIDYGTVGTVGYYIHDVQTHQETDIRRNFLKELDGTGDIALDEDGRPTNRVNPDTDSFLNVVTDIGGIHGRQEGPEGTTYPGARTGLLTYVDSDKPRAIDDSAAFPHEKGQPKIDIHLPKEDLVEMDMPQYSVKLVGGEEGVLVANAIEIGGGLTTSARDAIHETFNIPTSITPTKHYIRGENKDLPLKVKGNLVTELNGIVGTALSGRIHYHGVARTALAKPVIDPVSGALEEQPLRNIRTNMEGFTNASAYKQGTVKLRVVAWVVPVASFVWDRASTEHFKFGEVYVQSQDGMGVLRAVPINVYRNFNFCARITGEDVEEDEPVMQREVLRSLNTYNTPFTIMWDRIVECGPYDRSTIWKQTGVVKHITQERQYVTSTIDTLNEDGEVIGRATEKIEGLTNRLVVSYYPMPAHKNPTSHVGPAFDCEWFHSVSVHSTVYWTRDRFAGNEGLETSVVVDMDSLAV